jgi:hypothetical protein
MGKEDKDEERERAVRVFRGSCGRYVPVVLYA